MKIADDWERLARMGAVTACVAAVALTVLLMIIHTQSAAAQSEGVSRAALEQRILELERSLSMYTNAGAVIVVRDDGECGLRWFDAGARLGCGTSWVRYRLPAAGGGTVTYVEGAVPQ